MENGYSITLDKINIPGIKINLAAQGAIPNDAKIWKLPWPIKSPSDTPAV